MEKFLYLLVPIMALALGGCETAEGFGRDLRHAGRAIENSANNHKPAEPAPSTERIYYYED